MANWIEIDGDLFNLDKFLHIRVWFKELHASTSENDEDLFILASGEDADIYYEKIKEILKM